jgi:hypothetical protein
MTSRSESITCDDILDGLARMRAVEGSVTLYHADGRLLAKRDARPSTVDSVDPLTGRLRNGGMHGWCR